MTFLGLGGDYRILEFASYLPTATLCPYGSNGSGATPTLTRPHVYVRDTSALRSGRPRSRTTKSGPLIWLRLRLWIGDLSVANRLLPLCLSATSDSFRFLPHSDLRWLFEVLPTLHFAEHTFSLEALFQDAKGLLNVVVSDLNLQRIS